MEGIQISFFDTGLSDEEARLRQILKRGSGYENSRLRIYAAERTLNGDRFAEFLADEFYIGGHSFRTDNFTGFVDYNARGMIVREWKTNQEWRYNWRQIARVYREMISMGEFPEYSDISLFEEARMAGKGAPAPRMHYWGGD